MTGNPSLYHDMNVEPENDEEDDVELAAQQLLTRASAPQPASTHCSSFKRRLRRSLRFFDEWSLYLLCCLHLFVAVAPTISLLIVNAHYFHVASLSTSNSSNLAFSHLHRELHTDAVQGEGGVDSSLLSLVPANASSMHVAQCGMAANRTPRGLCYSVATNSSGGLRYADCAAIIPVDTLAGADIRVAPLAEVNLYGSACRPLPQGHPDMHVFNPYTVRCDLPNWTLARSTAPAPTPQPPPPAPPSPTVPTSSLPPLAPSEQITRLIFQTHARTTFLSPMQYWAMRSWIDRNADYRYVFYDDEDGQRFVAEFTHPLLSSAQVDDIRLAVALVRLHLPMAAYADLLRYMLILTYGGVYVDSDAACIDPLSSWIDYEQDSFIIQSNMDLQWILIAAPGHPIILDTLLSAVNNVLHPLEAELAISPLYETTGPPVLLDAISRYTALLHDSTLRRPIRVVPSDPPAALYASNALTLYRRPFNYFQFSNHLLLKACEVEWEQRLYEHVPWVFKQSATMAAYSYARIRLWNRLTVLLCVVSAVLWWMAYRSRWVQKSTFTHWSIAAAVVQVVVFVVEWPIAKNRRWMAVVAATRAAAQLGLSRANMSQDLFFG